LPLSPLFSCFLSFCQRCFTVDISFYAAEKADASKECDFVFTITAKNSIVIGKYVLQSLKQDAE